MADKTSVIITKDFNARLNNLAKMTDEKEKLEPGSTKKPVLLSKMAKVYEQYLRTA